MSEATRCRDEEIEELLEENNKLEAEVCRMHDAIMKLSVEADVHGKHLLAKTLQETAKGDA